MVVFVLIATLCMGCGSHVPEDDIKAVQQTLAEADSLRGMGIIMGMPFRDTKDSCSVENHDRCRAENEDSLRLAEAVAVLYPWRRVYADEYAKANYYYGRLLRAKDHYPEAMQCFINAIHSRSKDYHILGRVYSNMGTISHLAGEYDLSYEMYEHSADMFLRNGDTINYYYALNNMAFELAEQEKKEETLKILKIIQENASDSYAIALSCITKADLYLNIEEYDSAIYYIDIVQRMQYQISTAYLIKAQSYEALGKLDSALHYAKCVLAMPNLANEQIYNSLYITINYNPPASKEELLRQTSYRADIGMKGDYQHVQEAKAVEILYQDLQSKPYEKSIVVVICIMTIMIVSGIILLLYFAYRRKKLKKDTIRELQKQRSLQNHHRSLNNENKLLQERNVQLKEQKRKQEIERINQIEAVCKLLRNSNNLLNDISWRDYDKLCEFTNQHFYLLADKLKSTQILNEKEIRLAILVLIGTISDKQMARYLYYSDNTIRSTKRNVALKLGTTSANLRSWLIQKAIQ